MFDGDLRSWRGRAHAWSDSLLADHALFRLVWDNLAEVIPGKLYRSNHPTPARLASAERRLRLRTLINLRGHRQCGSDALSRACARKLGLAHHDMAFESRGAPHKDRILRFAEMYRQLDFPALMHCKSGADRAGLASGLAVLFEGGTARQAAAQLSWRYGHFSGSRTGILDAFFRLYGKSEGRTPFLDWVADEYDEAELKRSFQTSRLSVLVNDRILRRE